MFGCWSVSMVHVDVWKYKTELSSLRMRLRMDESKKKTFLNVKHVEFHCDKVREWEKAMKKE